MSDSRPSDLLDMRDSRDAIALAERVLAGRVPEDGPFKLIGAVNLLKGAAAPSGPTVWELTFKPKRLLPEVTGGEVGAGGEWIVRIDLASPDAPALAVRGD